MKKLMGFGAVSLIIGLILFALSAGDLFGLIFGRVNIEDKTYGTYEEGEVASGDIKYIVSKIGHLQENEKIFGIPFSKKTGTLYLIADNGGFVIIDVREDTAVYDEILEQTAARTQGLIDDTVSHVEFTGRAVEVTDEQFQMVSDYFAAQGLTQEYWENAISLYVLVQLDNSVTVIQTAVCCTLILVGLILLLIARRHRTETVYVYEKIPEELRTEPEAEDKTETEEKE
ncbi:MAG: hypothetical protein IKP95_02805 [Ruminococcus sp.]|nr:hypothetical protein [Ruminococcus sp.]MBR6872363.1 hypothetical protein [Ruminococcus sp.]